ncbi:RHS repeat domain-containing protein [Pseudoxanthomonas mexicana]|uniref:RHS repeat domain-containing protein n=1 Tax=Pseudoxanthomonas mexicana TaxID=128785 RepID=UPI001FD71364|nr:RHS repeat-associated core domain-containing protein [Pseudoxanthomonas mexicana]UOV02546.1 RHS domain-containing protein [Pseudoxanthomonas mexicana]
MERHLLRVVVCLAVWLVLTPFVQAQTTVEYIHTDALGTPVAVTNSAGAVIERSVYEPYGQLINRPLTDGPGFTGHVQDATTGLTYMQQRYYDPIAGVFLSVDPITAVDFPVGQFNRYRYANHNPYKFVDPDGRFSRYCGGGSLCDGYKRASRECEMTCVDKSATEKKPYSKKLESVQQQYPQVTAEMVDKAFGRLSEDNPRSSKARGKEWGWELEPNDGGGSYLTPSREGDTGRVLWSGVPGVTLALGHTHGPGNEWRYRYFSPDDVKAGNTMKSPVFMSNKLGEFRIYVPGMKLNGEVQEGQLRGGAAEGVLLCAECVPTGEK